MDGMRFVGRHAYPAVRAINHARRTDPVHASDAFMGFMGCIRCFFDFVHASVRVSLIRRREIAGGLLASHEKESSSIDLQIFFWSRGLARKRVQLDRPNVTLCKRSCIYIYGRVRP
jgi:hypothetical protein